MSLTIGKYFDDVYIQYYNILVLFIPIICKPYLFFLMQYIEV